MKVGLLIYSDMTEVEFVCVHECLSKVYQLGFPNPPECHIIGVQTEVLGWNGIVIKPHHYYKHVNLDTYDLLFIPGGWSSRRVRYNQDLITWLKGWDPAKPIAAVCSGTLILGEAGFLAGRKGTIHTLGMEAAKPYCTEVLKQRVVEDGNVITSGGIMAAYDLGLYLVEKFWGPEARAAIALQDEYRDVQSDPKTADILPHLDKWYDGGHIPSNKRPADWFEPSRDLG